MSNQTQNHARVLVTRNGWQIRRTNFEETRRFAQAVITGPVYRNLSRPDRAVVRHARVAFVCSHPAGQEVLVFPHYSPDPSQGDSQGDDNWLGTVSLGLGCLPDEATVTGLTCAAVAQGFELHERGDQGVPQVLLDAWEEMQATRKPNQRSNQRSNR